MERGGEHGWRKEEEEEEEAVAVAVVMLAGWLARGLASPSRYVGDELPGILS